MKELNLKAAEEREELVLAYLKENVSDILADKINNGAKVVKDGKELINKKTLSGFMKYACQEAQKQAPKGATGTFIAKETVYGWAVHYYMEDSVKIDTTAQAKVVAPKAEKQKESNPKQVKALVKDKQEDKCIQLDLFADF